MGKERKNQYREKMVSYKSLIRFSIVTLILVLGLFPWFVDENTRHSLRIAGIILFIIYMFFSLRKIEKVEVRENLVKALTSAKISLTALCILGLVISLIGRNRPLNASADEITAFVILLFMVIFTIALWINRKAFK